MLLFVRHGETESNRLRIVQVPETPLNERGRAQAARAAARLGGELEERSGATVRLISSDHERAHETARALARRLDLAIELEPGWQERNFGEHRGRSYADIGVDIMAPHHVPPGGESWQVFHDRVALSFKRLAGELEGPDVTVVVVHGLVLYSLALHHLDLGELAPPMRWANTSFTQVSSRAPFPVSVLNCTQHLDGSVSDDQHAVSGI